MSEFVLSLKQYGIANGDKTILSSLTLDFPEKGIVNLLGPTATGKSTLVRTLSGVNESNPMIRTWGEAIYLGEPLGLSERPAMVMQSAKLMVSSVLKNIVSDLPENNQLNEAQKCDIACRLLDNSGLCELKDHLDKNVVDLSLGTMRHLAIVRVCAANPRMIFIDEPTFGIEDDDAKKLLDYIKLEGEKRAVVVVTHNQAQARYLEGSSVLLAGGWVQEYLPTKHFFAKPDSLAAKEFIRSGTVSAPSPDSKPDEIDPECQIKSAPVPLEAKQYKSDVFGPRGFLWLKKGRLAGTPKPGIVAELEHDLEALQRVGISHLISLTAEMEPVNTEDLAKYSITSGYEPFEDMGVPTLERAAYLCEEIAQLINEGEAVAVHCKAGLGRTGTVLALHLIWEGMSAPQALEHVRKMEPRWVQSEEQVQFLEEFANEYANKTDLAVAVS